MNGVGAMYAYYRRYNVRFLITSVYIIVVNADVDLKCWTSAPSGGIVTLVVCLISRF